MKPKILIVEDEMLVAVNLEAVVEDLGCASVGIAPDAETAFQLCDEGPDLAFVDLNLRDGPTGAQIGQTLGARGVTVLYVTANPRMLGDGVPGAIGVMTKPYDERSIGEALSYALERRSGATPTPPPVIRPFVV